MLPTCPKHIRCPTGTAPGRWEISTDGSDNGLVSIQKLDSVSQLLTTARDASSRRREAGLPLGRGLLNHRGARLRCAYSEKIQIVRLHDGRTAGLLLHRQPGLEPRRL